jgi:hypothetical protein
LFEDDDEYCRFRPRPPREPRILDAIEHFREGAQQDRRAVFLRQHQLAILVGSAHLVVVVQRVGSLLAVEAAFRRIDVGL